MFFSIKRPRFAMVVTLALTFLSSQALGSYWEEGSFNEFGHLILKLCMRIHPLAPSRR
jgi:hypothetical protein